jgi:AraC-like DNA-binding protein
VTSAPGSTDTGRFQKLSSAAFLNSAGVIRYSFKEIAAILGFCDEYHFARQFKAGMGLTPGTWRQQVRTWREADTRQHP